MQLFKVHLRDWKVLNIKWNSTEIYTVLSNLQYDSTRLDNGLALNSLQVFIRTNVGMFYWHMHASLGLNGPNMIFISSHHARIFEDKIVDFIENNFTVIYSKSHFIPQKPIWLHKNTKCGLICVIWKTCTIMFASYRDLRNDCVFHCRFRSNDIQMMFMRQQWD